MPIPGLQPLQATGSPELPGPHLPGQQGCGQPDGCPHTCPTRGQRESLSRVPRHLWIKEPHQSAGVLHLSACVCLSGCWDSRSRLSTRATSSPISVRTNSRSTDSATQTYPYPIHAQQQQQQQGFWLPLKQRVHHPPAKWPTAGQCLQAARRG